MSDRVHGPTATPQFAFGPSSTDASKTTVRLGESTLADVALNRKLDLDALRAANPQIRDRNAKLLVGQEINLPICEAPAKQADPVPAGPPASKQAPLKDPLDTSLAQLKLKSRTELPPDELYFKSAYGDQALREYQAYKKEHQEDAKLPADEKVMSAVCGRECLQTYRESKKEFFEARQSYLKTGQVPPLKHHAPVEIIVGEAMTRAERYDANLVRQGLSPSYSKMNVDVDPAFLTKDEFREEWLARGKAELQACDDEYIRPGKKQKCAIEVKKKYMGEEYMEASWAATAAEWNGGAYIEKIKNSGPLGLTGRLIGRGVAEITGGDPRKYEEIGGAFGDLGDTVAGGYAAVKARARVNAYEASGGHEVYREPAARVANTAGPVPGRPSAPNAAIAVTGNPRPVGSVGQSPVTERNETFFISHGTDNPSFKNMGGLGPGRIRVDQAPGEHQDFGRGFYVAVGTGKGGTGIAEAAGNLRVAQRGSGPRQILAWEVKRSDLGDVVDVRPGGKHAEAWNRFLDQPIAPGLTMTIRDHIRGTGVEQRGVYFDKFLASIGKQNADAVIGPIGTPETSGGAAPHEGTQLVIRTQRAADRLNQIMGEASAPTAPAAPPSPAAQPAGQPTKVTGDTETRRSLMRENESAQILAQNGYRVSQNPKGAHAISKPDYEIDGRPFDSYAPSANKSPRGIWSYIKEEKLDKLQTTRVVLNLRDWNGDIDTLRKQFADHPLPGLDELLVVTKEGKVTTLGK
jgi:hypothetical protein